uniref:Uncharacterized protein n=1 Tax=Salix viminalis TaxID=40686 RepID=A0A6N2KFS6_SALVM
MKQVGIGDGGITAPQALGSGCPQRKGNLKLDSLPIHLGILPVKLLWERSNANILEELWNSIAIGPCNLFLDKYKYLNCEEAPILGAKGPERLFPDRSKNSREDIFPIHPGICPCKLLFENILPVKLLLDRSNSCSELMLPNEEGMLPLKPLSDIIRTCNPGK